MRIREIRVVASYKIRFEDSCEMLEANRKVITAAVDAGVMGALECEFGNSMSVEKGVVEVASITVSKS